MALRSAASDGIERYAGMIVVTARRAPSQKYHPNRRKLPVTPAEKTPAKKPRGAAPPYKAKIRFLRGPGLYTVPMSMTPAGRNAAGPSPCRARQKSSIRLLFEKPATRDHTMNHARPARYTGYPPYISASRPNGRRKAAVTREKAEAGQTADACGMSSSRMRVGKRTLKPETKYSCLEVSYIAAPDWRWFPKASH